MNYIGGVIKEFRRMSEMSRKALANNICSEKYVYLIEKGERTPSSDITRLFGDKLGVDLFLYYNYLGCISPIAVEENIQRFDKCRMENDLTTLKTITDKAIILPDFHKKPWVYEIEINRILYMMDCQAKCATSCRNT